MPAIKQPLRLYVYLLSIAVALGTYFAVSTQYDGTLFYIRLEEIYGFIGALYIYLALLPTPLYTVFTALPGKAAANYARRAVGISAFCFSLLHSSIAFFVLTDGFTGLRYLSDRYLVDIGLSSIALVILFVLAATSFDYAVATLGPWWKHLHRLVYMAGFLVVIHVASVGAHFINTLNPIPTVFFFAVFVLLILEAARLDIRHVIGRFGHAPRFSWIFVVSLVLLTILYMMVASGGFLLSAHHG